MATAGFMRDDNDRLPCKPPAMPDFIDVPSFLLAVEDNRPWPRTLCKWCAREDLTREGLLQDALR